MKPWLLQQELSRRLWGGERLAAITGSEPAGAGDPYGESWQIHPGSVILSGPMAGAELRDAVPSGVPLMAKIIDAASDLSLQVHPDDAYAFAHEAASGHRGKEEAWLILEAAPGAVIYWGFREDVTPEQVRQAIADENLADLLNVVPVTAGDVVYNPAGTVHAIGGGLLLYEIQQASDLTYRLYDFGRRDAEGRLRELHVNKALDVASLKGGNAALQQPGTAAAGSRTLLETGHFRLTEHLLPEATGFFAEHAQFLTVVDGEVHVNGQMIRAGHSAYLPEGAGPVSLSGTGRLLRASEP